MAKKRNPILLFYFKQEEKGEEYGNKSATNARIKFETISSR